MSSVNEDSLTYSFAILMHLFICFTEGSSRDIFALFLILGGSISSFAITHNISCMKSLFKNFQKYSKQDCTS